MQISALQESGERLDLYDRQLQKQDDDYAKGKIRRTVYERQSRDLVTLIREESEFQNAILIKDPKIKTMAQNLLVNIQKAMEATPLIVAKLALEVLTAMAQSHGTITP